MKKQLHGRRRKEIRESIVHWTRKRETDSKILFRSLGKRRNRGSIDRLIVGKRMVTEPEEVHKELTDNFRQWFKGGRSRERGLWEKVQSWEGFEEHLGLKEVPERLRRCIHQAIIQVRGREEVEAKLNHLKEGPSIAKLMAGRKAAPNGRSPGPTGLTYTMLKDMPDALVEEVWESINDKWRRKYVGDWLKKKQLVAIPKVESEDSDVKKMRPVMLIEVIRKLHSGAIFKEIREEWERSGILHPAQHGFRAGHSCASGIFQFINAMEASEEDMKEIFFSTWDIKRAFDSVFRELIELALRRLGVPAEVAEHFAYVDEGDTVQIKSPWSEEHKEAESFSTEQGAGQGDTASPSIWVAVMDILLTAVSIYTEKDEKVEFTDGKGAIQEIQDPAYADDFLTMSPTEEGLQHKAEIYSAAAIILGLQLVPEKLRTGAMLLDDREVWVNTYSAPWTCTRIKLETEGEIKYLGSTQPIRGKGREELKLIKDYLGETFKRLRARAGSPETHARYIKGAVATKIGYQGMFSSDIPIKDLDQLQGIHMKMRMNLPMSFPGVVLFGNTEAGGCGVERISDEAQESKLNIIKRLQGGDRGGKVSIEGILERQSRKEGSGTDEVRRL
jgi:hypothetical protein